MKNIVSLRGTVSEYSTLKRNDMLNRRNFLKNSGTLALAGLALSNASWSNVLLKTRPIGIQLFTFFGKIDNDLNGTLKQIADLGYKDLESAFSMKGGYYGLKPKEFANLK